MSALADVIEELTRVMNPGALAIFDRDMRYLFVTERWCRDYGLDPTQVIGRSHYDVFPELPPKWRDAHARCLAGATLSSAEDPFPRADGVLEWVSWEIRPWRLPDGSIGGLAIASERITRQKELAEANAQISALLAERDRLLADEREHRRRLEALRQSALAISMLDASLATRTTELLRLILTEACRLTHADFGALGVGTDPDKPFDPWVWVGVEDDQATRLGRHPRPIGLLGRIARDQHALRLDAIEGAPGAVGLPAGHTPIGPLLGVPIRARGESAGSFYLGRRAGAAPFGHEDQSIVELLAGHAAVALENARLYRQVHSDLRTREEMLAVVSHDLKNPLNAIALREQQLARMADPRLASHAKSVGRALDEMRRMIRSLLDVASLDAGQLRLDRNIVEVGDLIDEVVDTAKPIADDREVGVVVDVEPRLAWSLDRERMWQVLSNVVGNAIKFTPAGGRVTVSAAHVARGLSITISDTGAGIEAAALPHVFDRYFTTSKGHQGTGLGLYISRALIEAHGGTIDLTSRAGEGTVATITIPT